MANHRILALLVFLAGRAFGQSGPIGDYVGNYYGMLNNLGDARLSLADRRLFREEILEQYFLFEGSLLWNDLRPRGSRYVPPREYLDILLTDFPKGISFSIADLSVGSLLPDGDLLKAVVSFRLTCHPAGAPPQSYPLRLVLSIRQYNASSLSARIKSIDAAEPPATEPPPSTPASPEPPPTPPSDLPPALLALERDMLPVEGGTFTMGCTREQGGECYSDEKPAHPVTLSSFRMGKYEVTQAQWEAVMGTTVRMQRDRFGRQQPLAGEGPDYPMYYVSWQEVQEFIRRLNTRTGGSYRLPTEAEWEFAARGGNKSRGDKFAGGNELGSLVWYVGNSAGTTHPVGNKTPNELGLHDMSGNVREWCADWSGSYRGGSQRNPEGPGHGPGRRNRGGSWRNEGRLCRVAARQHSPPDARSNDLGFRLVAR